MIAYSKWFWLGLLLLAWPIGAMAQVVVPEEEFYRSRVVEILGERRDDFGLQGTRPYFQEVKVVFEEGPREGEEEVVEYGSLTEDQKLVEGEAVIALLSENTNTYIFDRYRLPAVVGMLAVFVALAVFFAGWRGLMSLVGLMVSVVVLVWYVVPQIMEGRNPLLTSLGAASFIALVSIYLAHGFSRRTTVAVVSTFLTIGIAVGIAQLFVAWTGLLGMGSEEAFYLQTSQASFVNLKGLLLGGIIIGALGVLDDITTAQAGAVDEIWKANPKLIGRDLYKRGISVGREHITSLVNTLALAYVGASFPALLLFTVYERPWWVVVNTEAIVEEVVRTLVGSIALMVAVPITTLIAAYWLPAGSDVDKKESAASYGQ